MINIKELLEKRTNYHFSRKYYGWYDDEWFDEVLKNETKEEVWFITLSYNLTKKMLDKLRDFGENSNTEREISKYYVAGVYNLGSPFFNTRATMELVHLTNKMLDHMDIGIYKEQMSFSDKGNARNGILALPDSFSSKYDRYLSELQDWINGSSIPEDDMNREYEFGSIPREDVSDSRIFPGFYSKKAIDVRRLLQAETLERLGDVADILLPRPIKDKTGKVVKYGDLKYPFDKNNLEEREITSITIQKNDILLPLSGNKKPFLVVDDIEEDVFVSQNIYVIRCKDIQPEYLFLYLNSEVFKTILESQSLGRFFAGILRDIPVIKPTKDASEYAVQAYILTHTERIYQMEDDTKRIMEYWNSIKMQEDKKVEKLEDILSMELLDTLIIHSTNQFQELLRGDWRELNDCFRVKAYKATLILAGSILEAVLIDWLSEIKGVNYFQKDYMVTDRNGRQKRADLIDYINEIKYIERPYWINEATKAHEIRKKRNLVHAKLGINSDDVNEETCKMVIDYLKAVIAKRGIEQ